MNLISVFKNINMQNLTNPDQMDNLIRGITDRNSLTISEDAMNSFNLGSQAKRMFNASQSSNQSASTVIN